MGSAHLAPGWYVDASPGHGGVPTGVRFRVLGSTGATLDVVDEHGVRRTVGRAVFEQDMVLEGAVSDAAPLRYRRPAIEPVALTYRRPAPEPGDPTTPAAGGAVDRINPFVTCSRCGTRARERDTALVRGRVRCASCI